MHFSRTPPIQVRTVGTKGRDLELQPILQHNDDAKVRTDRVRAREKFLHNLGSRIRRDIDVFGRLAADQIAHAATSKVRNVTMSGQPRDDLARGGFHRTFGFHDSAS